MRISSRSRRSVPWVIAVVLGLATASPVGAHGPAPAEPPSVASLLSSWTFEPLPTLGILAALVWWSWAVRRVDALHPTKPVPRIRTAAFVAGMAAIALALLSGIDRYDTTLFSIHMTQHVLLTLVAAPLIAVSGPVTLLLRVAAPETRRRVILPLLHARVTRVFAFPVVAWILFAGVMWVSHFSAIFDAALEDPLIHDLEHALYLGSALLFWWPAAAVDPAPWRMTHPVRLLYVFLQMTQNTFLSVVILNTQTVLYPHYATVQRAWGPSPIEDQGMAAALMWVAGDLLFLAAIFAILTGWSRAEDRGSPRDDRRAAAELAAIRDRERRLAERLAHDAGDSAADPQPGSGASR
ncbi:MAG TPA: cytochrome c oxidase assembly protein [Candidatus Limnocylindrales bacterium]|nr:cytochrome c oxidase assembly protein [Candidatus Limnocylindrales bacterium]